MHDIFERVIHTGARKISSRYSRTPRTSCAVWKCGFAPCSPAIKMLGAVVNITEVTEQLAQQDILRTQARILETMREGVVLVDAASMIVRLTNPTFERAFGYRSGELVGQSIEPLIAVPGHQRKKFERLFREQSHAGGPPPVEIECVRKDGVRFMVSCVISPLSMGGTDHWLAVVNDVTEKKRLERGIIDIANREQQRIGSDLHDGLGQELTGIALMLRGVAVQLSQGKVGRAPRRRGHHRAGEQRHREHAHDCRAACPRSARITAD